MINIKQYKIDGIFSFENRVFSDDRGEFFEAFNQNEFEKIYGDKISFVQDNISQSKKGVLRGLHFQKPPFAQAKLVRVIKGSVLDVAVDLRVDSPTFGQHQKIILSDKNYLNFFIPKGFAHGFVTLEEDTIFAYKCDNFYNKESEESLIWNDKDLGINWEINHPLLSSKDEVAGNFSEFKSPF